MGFHWLKNSPASLGSGLLALGSVWAHGDTNLVVLSGNQGSVLTRSNLSFQVPADQAASLRFEVGFATDEPLSSGEFPDSLTLTLRNADRTVSAALLTVDRFGPSWAPADPAGQRFGGTLAYEALPALDLAHAYALRFSFIVAVELPRLLLGPPGGLLLLSLFDNLDGAASLGWVRNWSLGPGLDVPVALESSASPAGPFAEESGVTRNHIQRTLALPAGGSARFYRLRSQGPSRILSMDTAGDELILRYDASVPELNLELQSAAQSSGPYQALPGARFDLTNGTVRVERSLAGAIFRLTGNAVAVITGSRVEGEDVVLTFKVLTPVPILESSAQAAGPFAAEMSVGADPVRRELRIQRRSASRFYRLRSERSLVIRHLERVGATWTFHYELP